MLHELEIEKCSNTYHFAILARQHTYCKVRETRLIRIYTESTNAAFTRSDSRSDRRLSDRLSVRQLDERLYGQTVEPTGRTDSRMDVYLIQLSDRLSDRQLEEHQSM